MAEGLTDTCTSSPTVKELCKALKRVKEWGELGINLKDMNYDVIKEIKEDEKTLEPRKMELFSRWLKLCHTASWEDVVAALESINENTIAKQVTDKYITGKDAGISSMTQVDDTSTIAPDFYSQEAQMESPPFPISENPPRLPEPETGNHGESHGVALYPKQQRSQSVPDPQVHKTESERLIEKFQVGMKLNFEWAEDYKLKIKETEGLKAQLSSKDNDNQKLQSDLKTQVKKSEKLEQQVTTLKQRVCTLEQQLYNTKQELKQRSDAEKELKHIRQELQESKTKEQETEHKTHSKDTKQEQELQNTKRELEETKMQLASACKMETRS